MNLDTGAHVANPKLLRSAQPTVTYLTNYDQLLRQTEQQKVLAREMIARAQQMIRLAVSMRERPHQFVLP